MAKKNLKVSTLKFEISTNLDEVLNVLEKLKLVAPSQVFFESRAEDWIYSEPSESDMDMVLKELGY